MIYLLHGAVLKHMVHGKEKPGAEKWRSTPEMGGIPAQKVIKFKFLSRCRRSKLEPLASEPPRQTNASLKNLSRFLIYYCR